MPAISAIIPELVPAPILVQGNALRSMSRQGARILGPAIGALSIAGFGFYPVLPFPFLCAAGIGFSLAGFGTLWETAVQRNVPRELLGRVGSVDSFGSFLMRPIAPVVAGLLIQAYGPAPLFVAGGAMAAALSVSALLVPSIRELRA